MIIVAKIKSIYNDILFTEPDEENYQLNISVRYNTDNNRYIINTEEIIMLNNKITSKRNYVLDDIADSVWILIFEDIRHSYGAIHALVVGNDGSHLNYMFVDLIDLYVE